MEERAANLFIIGTQGAAAGLEQSGFTRAGRSGGGDRGVGRGQAKAGWMVDEGRLCFHRRRSC
jgi:hypothetical protein